MMLQGAVKVYGGVRASARLMGVSPSTMSRLNLGHLPDTNTAEIVGRAIGVCPCCDQDWPSPHHMNERGRE